MHDPQTISHLKDWQVPHLIGYYFLTRGRAEKRKNGWLAAQAAA